MKKTTQFALAGLLHDIGKFMQRAGVELDSQSRKMENSICPLYKGNRTHQHVLWTHFFMENYFPSHLLGQGQDNLTNLASFHHSPQTEEEHILKRADHLSSGEDQEWEENKESFDLQARLRPVFGKIHLHKSPSSFSYGYPLKPLNSDKETLFPQHPEENLKSEYNSLWQDFLKEHQALSPKNPETYLRSLYYLLYKYTWCIPSGTIDGPDISLFDHARTTAAIASCLYEGESKPFLLLGGDITGIQSFIKNDATPKEEGGKKKTAKRFLGQSLFLSLLPEIIAHHILHRTGLNLTHLLYCGGGNFQILLPNHPSFKETISEIEKEAQKYFWSSFDTQLGLVIGMIESSSEEMKDFGRLLDLLGHTIDVKKEKQFQKAIQEIPSFFLPENLKKEEVHTCNTCRNHLAQEGEKTCLLCQEFFRAGEDLPKTIYFLYTQGTTPFQSRTSFTFGPFGSVYLLSDDIDASCILEEEILDFVAINDTGKIPIGFKFLGSYAATAESAFQFKEDHYLQDDILSFDVLANQSQGDPRIAFAKMDVDNLETIFTQGLENRSIARLSSLSRQLDLFFTGYCITSLKKRGSFYLSYAGGDDLFLAGPWDQVLDWLIPFVEDFSNYCAHNENITLSAGVFLCKPHFPLDQAMNTTENKLYQAKNAGKNRASLFGEIIPWVREEVPSLKDLILVGENFRQALTKQEDPISRRLFYQLLQSHKTFVQSDHLDHRYLNTLIYTFSRNVPKKLTVNGESFFDYLFHLFIAGKDAPFYFKRIRIPLNYALMKTRKGGYVYANRNKKKVNDARS